MKTRPIDRVIKELEKRADIIGLQIDKNEDYIFVCSVITDMDFGIMPDYRTKSKVFMIMEDLYEQAELDFHKAMQRIILEGWE